MSSNQPLTGLRAYETNRIQALAEEGLQLQHKTFQRWIQAKLEKQENITISKDFLTELRNGPLLMQLCVVLCGAPDVAPRVKSNRFQRLESINEALSFLQRKLRTDISDIGAEDIVDGKLQPTLRVLWNVILAHYARHENGEIKAEFPRSEKELKAVLLEWCRVECRKSDVDVTNFGSSWKNGLPFMALLTDYIQGEEKQIIGRNMDAEDPTNLLEKAFAIAEQKLGVPRLLDAEDFARSRHDEKSLMTYLMMLKESIQAQTGKSLSTDWEKSAKLQSKTSREVLDRSML